MILHRSIIIGLISDQFNKFMKAEGFAPLVLHLHSDHTCGCVVAGVLHSIWSVTYLRVSIDVKNKVVHVSPTVHTSNHSN